MSNILINPHQKYGYKMFNCTLEQIKEYKHHCYFLKKAEQPQNEFNYIKFLNIEDGIKKIKNIFIPTEHKYLGNTTWELNESNELLIKKICFTNYKDAELYQEAIERAWALGGHLDPRVEQIFYD